MRYTSALFAILILSTTANAQVKQTTQAEQLWLGYFNQARISDKWGVWLDAHLRTKEDFVSDLSQV
jgi:hypothetical protein